MSNPNDLAFPYTEVDCEGDIQGIHEGLTKREYFVALAMQAAIGKMTIGDYPDDIAKLAIAVADNTLNRL